MLHRNGLSPDIFSDPYAAIPLHAYLTIFEQAAEVSGDPNLGARLGFGSRPGNLAPIGLRAVQASTIRRALAVFARYSGVLQSGTQVSLDAEPERLNLSYLITAPVAVPCRQDTEFTLASLCALIRTAFDPRWRPLEVRFRHPEPAGKYLLEKLFGAPVLFSQPTNLIVMSTADVDRPYRSEDPDLIAMIERHLMDLIGEAYKSVSLTDRVMALVRLYLGVRPVGLETISAALQISPRSLQRGLAAEGQSLRGLVQGHRQRRAEALLGRGMSVEAVAAALGYADGTAFWRAYRGWTGENPSQHKGG